MKRLSILGAAILFSGTLARAATPVTVTITSTADTTLSEFDPDNNLGSSQHMNVGTTGPNANFSRMRGLMKFDLATRIPPGSIVTAAKVNVSVIRLPLAPAGPGSTFELHRILQTWTEGNKIGNSGQPASPGQVTWNKRLAGTPGVPWGAPGALSDSDINLAASSTVFMNTIARYTFPSTSDLIADVQGWVNDSTSNFGWLINSTSSASKSARQVGSRESASGQRPTLEVTFVPPEMRITEARLTATGMSISWTGGAPPFQIQRADDPSGPWIAASSKVTTSSATGALGIGVAAFYRVAGPVP